MPFREQYKPPQNIQLGNYKVFLHPEFAKELGEFGEKNAKARADVLAKLCILTIDGPHTGRPYVDHVKGSKHSNMKEMRLTIGDLEMRLLLAFGPDRAATVFSMLRTKGSAHDFDKAIRVADRRCTECFEALRYEMAKANSPDFRAHGGQQPQRPGQGGKPHKHQGRHARV